jgi:hypothetical protein
MEVPDLGNPETTISDFCVTAVSAMRVLPFRGDDFPSAGSRQSTRGGRRIRPFSPAKYSRIQCRAKRNYRRTAVLVAGLAAADATFLPDSRPSQFSIEYFQRGAPFEE